LPFDDTCVRESESDPAITDCLDCIVRAIYSSLENVEGNSNPTMEIMHCLIILANIHEEVKKHLEKD
jgi:hypothetical protein